MKVWYAPDLKIKGGDAINAGIKVEADFSTFETPLNQEILSIGVSERKIFYPALTLSQKNGILQFTRKVKSRDLVKDFTHDCWIIDFLKPSRNYHLVFEIDETRCRIKLWEIGDEENFINEYIFYGLMTSESKEILAESTTIGRILSLSTSRDYHVQFVSISDLGYGVGVEVPPPPTQVSLVTLTNANSGLKFGIYDVSLHPGASIVQRNPNLKSCLNLWELYPSYMPSRMPYGYLFKLTNMLSNSGASVKDCSSREYMPLINETTDECDTWLFSRPIEWKDRFRMSNNKDGLYAVVKDASKYDEATIWTRYLAEGAEGHWKPQIIDYGAPKIKDGVYTFKYKLSNLYMVPRTIPYGEHALVQDYKKYPNDYWYIKSDNHGLFTIQNVDTKQYVVVYNGETKERSPVVMSPTATTGNAKWIVDKDEVYNSFINLNSGDVIEADPNVFSRPGAEIMQGVNEGDAPWWLLTPVSFGPEHKFSGMYQIQNVQTGTFLGIKGSSVKEGEEVVSKQYALSPSEWWNFNSEVSGGFSIQNVNSRLYMCIKDASLELMAPGIQTLRASDRRGYSLWIFEPLNNQGLCRIKNVHSGKYLMFTPAHVKYDEPVIQVDLNAASESGTVWQLSPIKFFPLSSHEENK